MIPWFLYVLLQIPKTCPLLITGTQLIFLDSFLLGFDVLLCCIPLWDADILE